MPGALFIVAAIAAATWAGLAGPRPVVALLRKRTYGLPVTSLLLMAAGFGAIWFLVPYLFADVLHRSAEVTGAVLLASAAGMAAFSPLAGWAADRVGARRVAFAGGLVIFRIYPTRIIAWGLDEGGARTSRSVAD